MTVYLRHQNIPGDDSQQRRLEHAAARQTQQAPSFYRTAGKSVLDIVLVLAALPIIVPVIGILALLIALDGGAPFYRQKRVGRGGVAFDLFKLRTMVRDADEVLEQYLADNPDARREWEVKQKLCNDPRITRLGHLLRRSSIDELPQLWNVLRGDMSLIGPRPIMIDQQEMYPGTAYYRLRPGISGLWQVSERNDSSFADRAIFDSAYDSTLSFGTDLSILLRTIGVVIRGTGY